jgi:hypothetical protein
LAWIVRYVRSDAAGSGDGTTNTNSGANGAWTLAEAIANVAAGMQLNVKAGTYANTTTSRTFNVAGTTTAPIWWRGFKTAIGDMDGTPTSIRVDGTDIPLFSATTGVFTSSAAHNLFSAISFLVSGATANPCMTISGGMNRFVRCRFEHQNANAASVAVNNTTNGGNHFECCWFKATSTATRVVQSNVRTSVLHSVIRGGGIGYDHTNTSQPNVLVGNAFISCGSNGAKLAQTSGAVQIIGNTFYSCGSDAILITGTLTQEYCILNNLFSGSTGYDVNNNTGTNTNFIRLSGNSSYNPSTAHLNGITESLEFSGQTEVSQSVTSSSDMTPASGALARSSAVPVLFENVSFSTYSDIGAVDHQDPSSSGGATNLIDGVLVR